ncbi:uncharacterized protein LOC111883902 [Lactuca sativa]|uniref:F-box domain-containing protein n=1 Tax=Lactuca sativa TaxID=4236 RepID=A0A9R1UXL7_LACSA|nr:uncharacterized protein LOC111883902 [Lactuca sativa]KAJ0195691.1 hypothetical protein LSAT_V11C700359020 [Lactuca sativa]
MTTTRSETRIQNHDDDASSSCKKRLKSFDKGDVAPWSDVNHDMLFIVMMKLGVVDFLAFSRVCKSWRSFAVSNRNMFMVSKPPMKIRFGLLDNKEDYYCCFEDFEGKRFKTILPHSAGRTCVGLTCGYFIYFSTETRDFWLVNPITSHELHFPDYPLYVGVDEDRIKAILVFSPSISGWVFVVLRTTLSGYRARKTKISYYITGKRGWNHVSSALPILDLHVFKGKMYTLHTHCSLGELRLNLNSKCKGKWRSLETKSFLKLDMFKPRLVSSNEKLYVMHWVSRPKKVMELDFGEMKWVLPDKTIQEYAIFYSYLKSCVVIKPELWAGLWTQSISNGCFLDTDESQQGVFCYQGMWYFPHDCLNVNLLDE